MEKFKPILRMEIGNGRFVVVSKTIDGKVSIAQQIQVVDNEQKPLLLFLKNAILMDTKVFKDFVQGLSGKLQEENIDDL